MSFNASASKKTTTARGVQTYSVSLPVCTEEDFTVEMDRVVDFLEPNFDDMLTLDIKYKKED